LNWDGFTELLRQIGSDLFFGGEISHIFDLKTTFLPPFPKSGPLFSPNRQHPISFRNKRQGQRWLSVCIMQEEHMMLAFETCMSQVTIALMQEDHKMLPFKTSMSQVTIALMQEDHRMLPFEPSMSQVTIALLQVFLCS
jgi:hypothetical protein